MTDNPTPPSAPLASDSRDKLSPPEDDSGRARAFLWAGYICAVLALIFFMTLALLPVFGYAVTCGQRFPAVVVLALATGLAAGFIGGSAKAIGQIPLAENLTPVQFAVTGGFAAMIILLLLGWLLYVKDCKDVPGPPGIEVLSVSVPPNQNLSQVLHVFEGQFDVSVKTPGCSQTILLSSVRQSEIRARNFKGWLTELTYRVTASDVTFTVEEIVHDRSYALRCKPSS